MIHSSQPVQMSVTAAVLILSKIHRYMLRGADRLDDETEGEAKADLRARAAEIEERLNYFMKYSRDMINLNNHGYTLRLISKALRFLGRLVIAGAKAFAQSIREMMKNVQTDPFDIWDSSGDKDKITVHLEDEFDDRIRLGEISIDIDAPLSVMRLYLQRYMREDLNEKCGDSFLFLADIEGAESILHREEEEKTDTRIYVNRSEDESGKVSLSIRIMRDRSAELVLIPEFQEVLDDRDLDKPIAKDPILDSTKSLHEMS